ncbi:AzlD domain-containing protein [Nocardia sp. CDC159]|uniref:AzlD domain-containing protein n=1 Tax=Nocardia pulmonis TaxID=2951408 RepID=A0A9X2E5R7_9NOCA|nr:MULTISPECIES: AzlD domain-containing protein [Nocardia]MCM6774319.1 AzlD domain-containing protein [Nocardia pulmonis]MCM6787615.1 AzlD domain-containing protein [Nocardia sp. CDC159]
MSGELYVLSAVLVIAAVTFGLRAFLFVALRKVADSEIVQYLGRVMPGGVMLILVFYTVSSVEFGTFPYGAPSVLGILATAAVHHRWRNPLLSILSGTAVYLVLHHLMG